MLLLPISWAQQLHLLHRLPSVTRNAAIAIGQSRGSPPPMYKAATLLRARALAKTPYTQTTQTAYLFTKKQAPQYQMIQRRLLSTKYSLTAARAGPQSQPLLPRQKQHARHGGRLREPQIKITCTREADHQTRVFKTARAAVGIAHP